MSGMPIKSLAFSQRKRRYLFTKSLALEPGKKKRKEKGRKETKNEEQGTKGNVCAI